MSYLLLKWLHIMSATILFGTGMGSAFYCLRAHLSRDRQVIATTLKHVVQADWWFTTPMAIFQPLSGIAMLHIAGIGFDQFWIMAALHLYVFAGLCWLPVVRIQIRMRNLAEEAVAQNRPIADEYHRLFRWWFMLGWPAFGAFVVIFWLMVFKPATF